MGFLNGAYGKLMAGKLVRDLQYQMTGIQSRLRRVTRQVGDMEKMFTRQERNMKAQMQSQMQMAMLGYVGLKPGTDFGQFTPDMANAAFSGIDPNQYAKFSQMAQMKYAQSNAIWQNMFEMQRDSVLQALKDEEDDLQTQKDNLESRIKIAQAEYDAKKDEEKQGAQGMKPDYTGQG